MHSDNSVIKFSNSSNQALLDEIKSLRLQLAEAQQQSNLWYQQLHAISTSLKIGFWEWNQVSDKVIFYSNEMAALYGISIDELYSRCQSIEDFYNFVHPDDLGIYKSKTGSVKKHLRDFRDAQVFEYRMLLPDRKIRHVREMRFGVFDDQGNIQRSFGVIQDISEHVQTVRKLEKSEERFFSLFDQLPVGVVEEDYSSIKKAVDMLLFKGIDNIRGYLEKHPEILRGMVEGTCITNVNQALLDLHKAESMEEFLSIEADVDDWWDAEWVEFYTGEISALASGNRFFEAERADSKADGSHFETRSVTTIVKGHEKDWARVITIHEDITNRKRDETSLIEARDLAEHASRAKSEFLSSMSHELRTPLNAILGFSQLFDYDDSLNKQQRSNAGEINRAGKHLLVLTDEILDLSKIEAGEIEVSLEPVSLWDVIGDAMTWMENLTKSRSVAIHADEEVLSSIFVQADSIRLKQVFLNLLTNAVKYNRECGSIFIELEYRKDGKVCIGIRDTGLGIGDDKLGELFQPFNRLGAEASGTEGTGIGLVITKQLVKLMQGQLEVNSVPGMGTTFWVELSLAESAQLQQIKELSDNLTITESLPVLQSSQPYILVAEDNVINRKLMTAQMSMLGYQVEYAVNGAEALEKWLSGKYYVLITDIRMPVMDGYELIREIRSLDITGTHAVSIIAITANAMGSDIEKCFSAGANDVISKPVELEDLRKSLKKWVPREIAILENDKQAQLQSVQTESKIDLNVLILSVGNNPNLHRRLLTSFSQSVNEQIDDIEDAFSWRNHTSLADSAHKLKSSARSMGALELGDLCQVLELAGRDKRWPDIELTMPLLLAHCQQVELSIQRICHLPIAESVDLASVRQIGEDVAVPEIDISVLLVDDDFIMHRVTTTILSDLGIKKVRNALSGPKALEILSDHPDETELIICDLNMPEMDGVEFMRHLAQQQYSNSLILTSGEDIRILRTVEKLALEHDLKVVGVIEKPVTPAKINEIMETFDQISSEGTKILTDIFRVEEFVEALKHDQLDVFFQPKVNLMSSQVVGVEALVRWNHPSRGLIRPDAFIPMAEDHGLINQLTQQVCKKSIKYASEAKDKGFDLNIAINISVDALNDLDWPDHVAKQVENAGLDHSSVTFEITESRLMEHISVALDILSRLSLKRFNLSIDDFGTGYSSMEQLQRIPFSELKIDRAFVNGASADNSARAILESSVLLAKKLNMSIVAEGVENQQDWDLLMDLDVDQVQGYFISRPLAFDQFLIWLEKWQLDHT